MSRPQSCGDHDADADVPSGTDASASCGAVVKWCETGMPRCSGVECGGAHLEWRRARLVARRDWRQSSSAAAAVVATLGSKAVGCGSHRDVPEG